MIHTFKSETSRLFQATLFLSLGAMLLLFWYRHIIPGTLLMIGNILLIRSFLHTEYQISDHTLRIIRGYLPPVELPLQAIDAIAPGKGFCSSMACARPTVTVIAAGNTFRIAPRRPELFTTQLQQAIARVQEKKQAEER